MAVVPTVLRLSQLQKRRLKEFRHHFTDQCLRKPEAWWLSKEGIPSISVLSNHIRW